jgi:hypothetical protein
LVAHELRGEWKGGVVFRKDVLPHFRAEFSGGLHGEEWGHKKIYAAKMTA